MGILAAERVLHDPARLVSPATHHADVFGDIRAALPCSLMSAAIAGECKVCDGDLQHHRAALFKC